MFYNLNSLIHFKNCTLIYQTYVYKPFSVNRLALLP